MISETETAAEDQVYNEAIKAHKAGQNPSFRQCLQRYVLIRECKRRSPEDRRQYLDRLARRDVATGKGFYDACDMEMRAFRELYGASSPPPPSGQQTSRNPLAQTTTGGYGLDGTSAGSMPLSYSSVHQSHRDPGRDKSYYASSSSSPSYLPPNRGPHLDAQRRDSKAGPTQGTERILTSRANQGPPQPQRRQSFNAPNHQVPSLPGQYNVANPVISNYPTGPDQQNQALSFNPAYTSTSTHGPTSALGLPLQAPRLPGSIGSPLENNDLPPIKSLNSLPSTRKRPITTPRDDSIDLLDTVEAERHDYRGVDQEQWVKSSRPKLEPDFRVQNSSFFFKGRVFKILWPEPEGETRTPMTRNSQTLQGSFGERIHSKPVRMVVVQMKPSGYSHCIRINTYGGQGTRKKYNETERLAHAIIHSSTEPPELLEREQRLKKQPIAVDLDAGQTLESASRIHFGKIYTVEHNVKVKPVGRIAKESMPYFTSHFKRENFDDGRTEF